MSRVTHTRIRMPRLSSRRQPSLERLEDRWVPSSVREVPGFDANSLRRGDDLYSAEVPLGFSINFNGQTFHSLFVNNNGNVTFGQPAGGFNPYSLAYINYPIIAPFFADVDTRVSGEVRYGTGQIDGRNAFGVTWDKVGYYDRHGDLTNTFQLVLIDRSDVAEGAFDIMFNYGELGWDQALQSSSTSARIGFSTVKPGFPDETYEVPGSAVPGVLIHGEKSLDDKSLIFEIRTHPPIIDPIARTTLYQGQTFDYQVVAHDPDPDQALTYTLIDPPLGASIDPLTGRITWKTSALTPKGDYRFTVQVTDSTKYFQPKSVTTEVSVQVVSTPTLTLNDSFPAFAGDAFTLTGNLNDETRSAGWSFQVKFNDGSVGSVEFNHATGNFTITNRFEKIGLYSGTITVSDAKGWSTTQEFAVSVLDAQAAKKISQSYTSPPIQAGSDTLSKPLPTPQNHVIQLGFTHVGIPGVQPNAMFSLTTYSGKPISTDIEGEFFDIQATGIHPYDIISLNINFKDLIASINEHLKSFKNQSGELLYLLKSFEGLPGDLVGQLQSFSELPGDFLEKVLARKDLPAELGQFLKPLGAFFDKIQFGYLDPATHKWVNLRLRQDIVTVTFDLENGMMTASFYVKDIPLNGTVFTISLPSATTTVTAPVQGPTASVGTGQDTSRSVSFINNSTLSLTLTASRETQTSVSGTSQGSQAANSAANGVTASGAAKASLLSSTTGVGGRNNDTKVDPTVEEATFWRWLQSDDGILELLLHGVDPAWIVPRKMAQDEAENSALAAAPIEVEHGVIPVAIAEEEIASVNAATPEGASAGYGEFTAALLALMPGLLGERRKKRRVGLE